MRSPSHSCLYPAADGPAFGSLGNAGASLWFNEESFCGRDDSGHVLASSKTKGCPSMEQLQDCDPDYIGENWCITNEMTCKQQADCVGCDDESFDEQIGQGWAFCDYLSGEAELPVCECMDSWQPDPADCPKADPSKLPTFTKCSSAEDIYKACGKVENNGKMGQAYCKTKQATCKEQSDSNVSPIKYISSAFT